MTATFGDFLRPAGQHITAAVSFPGEIPGSARGPIIHQLARLIGTLARYSADLPLPDEFDPASRPLNRQAQAALDARLALRRATQSLRHGTLTLEDVRPDRSHPVVAHLSAAADYLAAGRDLLQTHFIIGPSGERAGRSYWVPVITSEPVTTALLTELAGHARTLAPWAAKLSISGPIDPGAPASACVDLHTATRWLWVAGATLEAAQRPRSAEGPRLLNAEGPRLLNAVPANLPPPRRPLTDGESRAELCDGIAVTAERLRHAALTFAAQARWSPATTSASWRRSALGSAITGHASEIILRTLTERALQMGSSPAIHEGLQSSADAMAKTWPCWRAVARRWDSVTTGLTPGVGPSPVAAEFGDLVLRTGRLAYRNPAWTPALARRGAIRSPADLAPDPSDLVTVLAALHTATDAIARSATEDRETVRAAADERRLYMQALPLPPMNGGRPRYRQADPSRVEAILATYDTAIEATTHATAALDNLAIGVDAPTAIYALARRASPVADQGRSPRRSARHRVPASINAPETGGMERMLRGHRFSDPALLARAGALDDATHELLAEATALARRTDSVMQAASGSPGARQRSTSTPASSR